MTQEAMKLALEALEELFDTNGYWWQEVDEQTIKKIENSITAITETLAQTQEPDYWLGYGLQAHTEKPFESATPLYTHPQRTWVGLTKEEVLEFTRASWGVGVTASEFIRAIEAKLKDKNDVAQETNS